MDIHSRRVTGCLVSRGVDTSEIFDIEKILLISQEKTSSGIDAFIESQDSIYGLTEESQFEVIKERLQSGEIIQPSLGLLNILLNTERLQAYTLQMEETPSMHEILSLGRHSVLSSIINLLLLESLDQDQLVEILDQFNGDMGANTRTIDEIYDALFLSGALHDVGKGVSSEIFNTVMRNGAIQPGDLREKWILAHPIAGWYTLNRLGFPSAFQNTALLHQIRLWEKEGSLIPWSYPLLNDSHTFVGDSYDFSKPIPPTYVRLFMIADSLASIVGKKPEQQPSVETNFEIVKQKLYERHNNFNQQYGLKYRSPTDSLIRIMEETLKDNRNGDELHRISQFLANTYDNHIPNGQTRDISSTDTFTAVVIFLARRSDRIQKVLSDLYPDIQRVDPAYKHYLEIYDIRYNFPQ